MSKYSKSKYSLMRTLSREVPRHVGDFFEQLGKNILNASFEVSPDEADMARHDLDLGIEVKSRGLDHSFHIPASQLLAHVESAKGWPYSRYMYCFFGYRGRETRANEKGKRLSLLAKCKNAQAIRYVLAQNSTREKPIRLHMLDISIIEAMHRKWGSVRNPIHSGLENVVEIRHATLNKLSPAQYFDSTDAPLSYLQDLGLNPMNFEIIESRAFIPFKDGFFEYCLNVSITKILPRAWIEDLEATIFPFIPSPRFEYAEEIPLPLTSRDEELAEV